MSTVLLLILLFISIILTGLILIQRSEGGALGIGGGGGGGGGFMSGRSAANSVTRMTGILGAAFLVCSLALSIVFDRENVKEFATDKAVAAEEAKIEAEGEGPLTNPFESGEETDPLEDAAATVDTDTGNQDNPDAETATDAGETPAEEDPDKSEDE